MIFKFIKNNILGHKIAKFLTFLHLIQILSQFLTNHVQRPRSFFIQKYFFKTQAGIGHFVKTLQCLYNLFYLNLLPVLPPMKLTTAHYVKSVIKDYHGYSDPTHRFS